MDVPNQGPPKQLFDARTLFSRYLQHREAPHHYLSVDRPDAPLRRADNNKVSASPQLAYIQDNFRWDHSQRRWMRKDGGQIVTEDEIYDVILSYQRVYQNNSRDELYGRILQVKEGVQVKDIAQAVKLWTEHNLGLLLAYDDDLWGGPAAVFDPNKPGQPARRHSRSTSRPPGRPQDYRFHETKPHYLHVSTCKSDGTDVWLSMSARTGSQSHTLQSVFHDSSLNVKAEETLGILWNEEFKVSRFPPAKDGGTHDSKFRKQRRAQRSYLYNIIQSNSGQQVPGLAQDNTSRNPRESCAVTPPIPKLNKNKRRRTTHGVEHESEAPTFQQTKRRQTIQRVDLVSSESPEPILPKTEPDIRMNAIDIPPNAIARTSLLVSASDKPARAPANVPFEDCLTQAQLFETLIVECNLKGKAAIELSEVSVAYTWGNQRQHLIRRGRPRDWNIFCMDITKIWERDGAKFAEDGCEIKMMVHVDS